jgi:hypothetical protein
MMIRRATGRISSYTDEAGAEQQAENLVWKNNDPAADPEPYVDVPIKDSLNLDVDTDVAVDLNGEDDDVIAKRC